MRAHHEQSGFARQGTSVGANSASGYGQQSKYAHTHTAASGRGKFTAQDTGFRRQGSEVGASASGGHTAAPRSSPYQHVAMSDTKKKESKKSKAKKNSNKSEHSLTPHDTNFRGFGKTVEPSSRSDGSLYQQPSMVPKEGKKDKPVKLKKTKTKTKDPHKTKKKDDGEGGGQKIKKAFGKAGKRIKHDWKEATGGAKRQ